MSRYPTELQPSQLNITTPQELLKFFVLTFYYSQGFPSLQHWIIQLFIKKGGKIAPELLTDATAQSIINKVVLPANHTNRISNELARRELTRQINYLYSSVVGGFAQSIKSFLFPLLLQEVGLRLSIFTEVGTTREGRFGIKSSKSILREILAPNGKTDIVKQLLQQQFSETIQKRPNSKLVRQLIDLDTVYFELYQEHIVPHNLLPR